MATVASRDEFWLGLYDNDLSATLMSLNYGGIMGREDLFDFLSVISDVVDGATAAMSGVAAGFRTLREKWPSLAT